MNIRKIALLALPWALILILSGIVYKQCSSSKDDPVDDNQQVITNNMVVEKIEAIGKLELVRFYIKDIIEHTTKLDWWPDPKIVLMVSGEVIGCVDLSQLDTSSVKITQEEVIVTLPPPEICTFRIKHDESKIYNVESKLLSSSELIDKAYKEAELSIKSAAIKMNIYEHVRMNARTVLQPMLENLTGKRVVIKFRE